MRHLKREGYVPEEELSGVTTVVTDKSKDGLPNGQDREKEQVLPPGSATPSSPKKEDSSGGNERQLKQPAFNAPGTGEDGPAEHPRSLPTPGEDAGSPTKFDYGMPTRRSMEATTKEAYRPRLPWRRQRRQKPLEKLDSKRRYKLQKSRIKQRMKIWYKSVKKNQNFRTKKENRREDPAKYERRKAGTEDSLAREIIATLMREGYTPTSMSSRRHKHHGPELQKHRREYRKNRATARRKHHVWYARNHNKPAFKRRQEMRRKNPARFRMRPASVLTTPEIAFVVGRDMRLGYVHSVSPMTGLVTIVLTGPVLGGSSAFSMPTMVFLNSVVFLSPQDVDAMFELIDVEVGDAAYANLSPEGVRQCATLYGISPDSEEFKSVCQRIEDGGEVDPRIHAYVSKGIVDESLHDWGDRSTFDPKDEFQTNLSDPTDDNLYFGEVMLPGDVFPEMPSRVASRWLQAGELGLYNQEPAGDWEKPLYTDRPEKHTGPGQWTKTNPSPTHDPTPPDFVPPNEVYFPASSGKVIPEDMKYAGKTAATIDDIARRISPDVEKKSRGVRVRLSRADPVRGIWTFQATGSKGKSYTIRVKAIPKGNVKDVAKSQIQVSCDCDFFRYQGPEHWANSEGYLYGKPRGTAAMPVERDPRGQHRACKHSLAALNLARKYRTASEGVWWPHDAELVTAFGSSVDRVVARYGGHQEG